MRTRDSFGEAMAATWKVCLSEPVRAGDPLVVQDIARASRLSATPVREALAWLAGHGLVERRVGRGYFVPDPSAAEVAQLYELHCRYLLWSLEAAGSPGRLEPVPDALNVQERTAWLFRCIMMGCGDAAMAEAQGPGGGAAASLLAGGAGNLPARPLRPGQGGGGVLRQAAWSGPSVCGGLS